MPVIDKKRQAPVLTSVPEEKMASREPREHLNGSIADGLYRVLMKGEIGLDPARKVRLTSIRDMLRKSPSICVVALQAVQEAVNLQTDLQMAGITPMARGLANSFMNDLVRDGKNGFHYDIRIPEIQGYFVRSPYEVVNAMTVVAANMLGSSDAISREECALALHVTKNYNSQSNVRITPLDTIAATLDVWAAKPRRAELSFGEVLTKYQSQVFAEALKRKSNGKDKPMQISGAFFFNPLADPDKIIDTVLANLEDASGRSVEIAGNVADKLKQDMAMVEVGRRKMILDSLGIKDGERLPPIKPSLGRL